MGNSKIVYYGETLIDLTGDTVEAAKLLKGVTAHNKKGDKITGTFEAADPYAIIGVTYPEGSVCTCSNGSVTLTAKDTTGKALFVIPTAGTWTVKAVKGSKSTSKTVSITAEGQVKTVEINFGLYAFKENEGIGSGLSLRGINYISSAITNSDLPYESAGISITTASMFAKLTAVGENYWISEKVDVSNYSALKLDLDCSGRYNASYAVSFGVGLDVPTSQQDVGTFIASAANIYSSNRQTHAVDISNVSGEVFLKIKGYAVAYRVYNWWLE